MAEDPQARAVMVSAVEQRAKLVECIEFGTVDFVVKPFERSRLGSLFTKYARPRSPGHTDATPARRAR